MKTYKFFDTSTPYLISNESFQIGSFYGLIGFGVNVNPIIIPHLDDASPDIFGYVNFDEYWNRVIFVDQKKNTFTRKEIILAVANQDGGAHVAPEIDEKYKQLAKENSLGLEVSSDGKIWNDTQGSELAAVRQIGHEILRTFHPNYPHKKSVTSGNGYIVGGINLTLAPTAQSTNSQSFIPKVSRNEKCPCGSGLKYKKCHGK